MAYSYQFTGFCPSFIIRQTIFSLVQCADVIVAVLYVDFDFTSVALVEQVFCLCHPFESSIYVRLGKV